MTTMLLLVFLVIRKVTIKALSSFCYKSQLGFWGILDHNPNVESMKKFLALLPLIAITGCGSPSLQERCVSALQAKRDLPEYWFRNGKTGYVIRETFAGNKKIVWQFAYQDPQKGYRRMRGFCNWNKATDEIKANMQGISVFIKEKRDLRRYL